MLKQLKDLNIYEAWELSKKYCTSDDTSLSSEEFDEMCDKCPFNSEAERKENCPLCNNLFAYVGTLSRTDLEKTVEVDGEDYVQTIYADGEVYMTVENKDAKIRNQKTEIQNLLTVNNSLRDRIIRLKNVVGGQQRIIEDLVD